MRAKPRENLLDSPPLFPIVSLVLTKTGLPVSEALSLRVRQVGSDGGDYRGATDLVNGILLTRT
jgi:hypothetical protein